MLFYLLGLGLIVVPLMLVEFAIGRGRSDAANAIANVASDVGRASRPPPSQVSRDGATSRAAGWILPARLLAEEIGLSLGTARSLQVLLRFIGAFSPLRGKG